MAQFADLLGIQSACQVIGHGLVKLSRSGRSVRAEASR